MPESGVRSTRIHGFTYLGILFVIAFVGIGMSVTATVWSTAARRSNEQQLLFVGDQFRRAIASYYLSAPAGAFRYPQSLDELIEDDRGAGARHLRKLFFDPMTGMADWELITLGDGAIIGVASSSPRRPLKRDGFTGPNAGFKDAECYCDWRFVYLPELQATQRTEP